MKYINSKSRILSVILLLGMTAILFACMKETRQEERKIKIDEYNVYSDETTPTIQGNCGTIHQKDLIREDGQIAGNALVYNDQKYFYVELSTFQGFYMWDAYLHLTNKYGSFPMDQNNNPNLSHFSYTILGRPMSNMKKFRIPINELKGASYVSVAVETKFLREEFNAMPVTAWVNGKVFGASSKGRAFFYLKQICREDQASSDYTIE